MMENVDDLERLKRLQELVAKMTPGPWVWWAGNPWHADAPNHPLREAGSNAPQVITTGASGSGFFYKPGAQGQAKDDLAAICQLRDDIEWLLELAGHYLDLCR